MRTRPSDRYVFGTMQCRFRRPDHAIQPAVRGIIQRIGSVIAVVCIGPCAIRRNPPLFWIKQFYCVKDSHNLAIGGDCTQIGSNFSPVKIVFIFM